MVGVLPQNHRSNLAWSTRRKCIQNVILWRINHLVDAHFFNARKQLFRLLHNMARQHRAPFVDSIPAFHMQPFRLFANETHCIETAFQ